MTIDKDESIYKSFDDSMTFAEEKNVHCANNVLNVMRVFLIIVCKLYFENPNILYLVPILYLCISFL